MLHKNANPLHHVCGVAALALVLGAGLFAAEPAKADHDDGPRFGFFFGFPPPPPPPPVVVYGPPPVYYYEPGPRIVFRERPYYRDWRYRERHHDYWDWRDHRHRGRHHRHDHD